MCRRVFFSGVIINLLETRDNLSSENLSGDHLRKSSKQDHLSDIQNLSSKNGNQIVQNKDNFSQMNLGFKILSIILQLWKSDCQEQRQVLSITAAGSSALLAVTLCPHCWLWWLSQFPRNNERFWDTMDSAAPAKASATISRNIVTLYLCTFL